VTRPRIMASVVVVALALTTAVAVPTICVLSALVALNFVLGRRENVPFSTYPMFSRPGGKAWALRFEGPGGERFPIADMGISPQVAKKRFGTEVSAAHVRGVTDLTEARRLGAEAIAAQIQAHPRFREASGVKPITIVLMEYTLESGHVVTLRTPLLTTSPP
jgi:hypothetical protein